MQILIAILTLSFLIIVHEFGHFTVAKLSGIKVHEFALFMGPKLFSKQWGETTYSLRLVPLGGFVKMEGEEETSEDSRAFNKKPIWVRAAVIAAGPFMNLLAAMLILMVIFSMTGYETTKINAVDSNSAAYAAGIRVGDKLVSYNDKKVFTPTVDIGLFSYVSKDKAFDFVLQRGNDKVPVQVNPVKSYKLGFTPKEDTGKDSNVAKDLTTGAPAEKGGMIVNDRIIKLNDTDVGSRQEIGAYLNKNKDKPLSITVQRGESQSVLKNIIPILVTEPIGVSFENVRGNIMGVTKHSLEYGYSLARSVGYSFLWLVTGKVPPSQLMGPVGIVTTIGDVVKYSPTFMDKFVNLLSFTALISINLGLFNLVPFPALDGSKLVLLGVEGIRRKAIPPEREAAISLIGLTLLIMLMVFATYNDVVRKFFGG